MKIVYILIGSLALILGVVGVVLPILPTTPFLFVTAYCYLKGSKRLYEHFSKTNLYRKYVVSFVEQKGMTLKTKLCILIPVYLMLGVLFVIKDILLMRLVIAILLVVKTIVFCRIKTIKEPINKNNA